MEARGAARCQSRKALHSHQYRVTHIVLTLLVSHHKQSLSPQPSFMDFDFRCNRLSCRKSLTDKAVVVSNPLASLIHNLAPIVMAFTLTRVISDNL